MKTPMKINRFANALRRLPAPARLFAPLRQLAGPRRLPNPFRRMAGIESLNFLVTNRVPRVALTRGMGWYSGIRSPTLTRASLAVWRLFSEVDLSDAEARRYRSLQEVFTRRLVPGARPVEMDPAVFASPSDAIVGACGRVEGGLLLQAKGSAYRLQDLLRSADLAREFEGGVYVTLRLTSSMYHRFHAPHDLTVDHVTYVSGDAYNVNPPALARVPGLFCRNERAVLRATLDRGGHRIALVPVAAILVASIRLHCIDVLLRLRHRGPNEWACQAHHDKGEEMGWFEHGSTIIVFAPAGFTLAPDIAPGRRLRMGQALMRCPEVGEAA
jgi:phosphatidylserine decarboxylase